jgi:hypothetical protein
VLPGRNCILGSLVDRTFTCAATLADDGTILCTDKGDICLVEKSDGNQRVVKRMQLDFSITCVAVEACSKYAWFGGKQGEIRCVSPPLRSSHAGFIAENWTERSHWMRLFHRSQALPPL